MSTPAIWSSSANGRFYFRGRKGGVINVGGLKVYPEEVEAVLNADPRVRMSLVKARRNPLTGSLVVAEVVLADSESPVDAQSGGQDQERPAERLPPHAGRSQGARAVAFRSGLGIERRRQAGAPWSRPSVRNVIVTGGSRGLGLAMSGALAGAGYRVIAVARKRKRGADARRPPRRPRKAAAPSNFGPATCRIWRRSGRW